METYNMLCGARRGACSTSSAYSSQFDLCLAHPRQRACTVHCGRTEHMTREEHSHSPVAGKPLALWWMPYSAPPGHDWDGIQELNNPLPRWWLWSFYATIVWAIGFWIFYQSPLINTLHLALSTGVLAGRFEELQICVSNNGYDEPSGPRHRRQTDPDLLSFARGLARLRQR